MNDTIGDELRAAGAGAASGIAATGAMSVLMVAARETGVMSELPPHEIADESVQRTDARDGAGPMARDALGWALHFGFGAVTGAMYAVLRRHTRLPGPEAVHGIAFGLGVWTVSYLGWIPALDFLPPATRDEPGRPPTMVAAHVIFGAILAGMVRALAGRR